jgi:hypothetical protein
VLVVAPATRVARRRVGLVLGRSTPMTLALAAVAVGALLGAGTSTAPVSDLSKAACALLIAGAGRQFRQSATGIGRAG